MNLVRLISNILFYFMRSFWRTHLVSRFLVAGILWIRVSWFSTLLKMPPAVFGLWCAFLCFFSDVCLRVSDISIVLFFHLPPAVSDVFSFFFSVLSALGSLASRLCFLLSLENHLLVFFSFFLFATVLFSV